MSLAPFDRLCRICGAPNAVIFRLQDKAEVVERVNTILGLKINLKVATDLTNSESFVDIYKLSTPVVIMKRIIQLVTFQSTNSLN